MFLRIRVIAVTLSICIFLNSHTSRAGINNVERQLQMFAVQVCLIMMGKILEPKMVRNFLRYMRGERGQALLPNEQQIADEISVEVERNPEGIISMFASLSITSFNVAVMTGLDEPEEIIISSEQYNEIRSLHPMLADLMPIPFPGQPVMVDIAPSIFHALMSLTRPIVPPSTVANPSDSNFEDDTVEVLEVILDHADTYSSLMSSNGILITLSLLLQVEELSSTYGLLFRGNAAEDRYRPCFRDLFEDYRRILVIADPNTSAVERNRLLKMLIKQYKEDRDDDYLENPLTNHYQNQLGAIRYLMNELIILMDRATELYEKFLKDLKEKKKENKPIDQELNALQAKSEEMERLKKFLVKFKWTLNRIEKERFALFVALRKILKTELEEQVTPDEEEVSILTHNGQPESHSFPLIIVSSDGEELSTIEGSLVDVLQGHVSTYSFLISEDGIVRLLNFLQQVEQLSIDERYKAYIRLLLEDYRQILTVIDPNTSSKERIRLIKELISQYIKDRNESLFLSNPLTNHYENQIAAIRYIMHEIIRDMKCPNHLLMTFRHLLRKIEEERFALFLAMKNTGFPTVLEGWFNDLADNSDQGFDARLEAYKPKEEEISQKSKRKGEKTKKSEKKQEVKREKKEKLERKKSEYKLVVSDSSSEHTSSSTVSSHLEAATSTSSSFLTTASSSTGSSVSGSPRTGGARKLVRSSLEDFNPFKRSAINHNGKDEKDKEKDKDDDKDKDKK